MPDPVISSDFKIVAGDQFQRTFFCFAGSIATPVRLTGWTANFSVRQNFGDSVPLIALSSTSPTAQGSIAIAPPAGSTVPNGITVTVFGSATATLPAPMARQREGRLQARLWVVDTLGASATLWEGALYIHQAP